jgi:hypothetical protein
VVKCAAMCRKYRAHGGMQLLVEYAAQRFAPFLGTHLGRERGRELTQQIVQPVHIGLGFVDQVHVHRYNTGSSRSRA